MGITERRPTLTDCGCEATVHADGSGIELHYCPMHQAAPQLLEALRLALPALEWGLVHDAGNFLQFNECADLARAAIAAAGV